MQTNDRKLGEWENRQTIAMRLAYIVFSAPLLVVLVWYLNDGILGDPLSVGFQVKLFIGLALLVGILVFPVVIHTKLAKLRTPEQTSAFIAAIKPFPVETPIVLYLLSFIFLPVSMLQVWFGIVLGIVLVLLSELYLRRIRVFAKNEKE